MARRRRLRRDHRWRNRDRLRGRPRLQGSHPRLLQPDEQLRASGTRAAKTATCPTGQTALNWNQNGAIIVARSRLSTPTQVPYAGGSQTSLPITAASWAQPATGLQQLYVSATASYPTSCSLDTGDSNAIVVSVYVDGNPVAGVTLPYAAGQTVASFPQPFSNVLSEPGTTTTHTVSATAVYTRCRGAADTPTLTSLKIDVVGFR